MKKHILADPSCLICGGGGIELVREAIEVHGQLHHVIHEIDCVCVASRLYHRVPYYEMPVIVDIPEVYTSEVPF